jgi:hypothetical protein
VERDVLGLIDHRQTAVRRGFHQVAGQLGLAIDHDVLAGQFGDVDADQPVAIGEVEALFDQPLGVHALVDAQPLHQVGGHRFQHTGADPDSRHNRATDVSTMMQSIALGCAANGRATARPGPPR